MAAEVKTITSESLEAAYRQLTPSQSGFTSDLMASNVIIPVLDLSASASSSSVPSYLSQALAFGSQNAFSQVGAGTTVIINTPGFWRVIGTANIDTANANHITTLSMTDGLSVKNVWQMGNLSSVGADSSSFAVQFDLIVFLSTGESMSATCSTASYTALTGSSRQIADVNGTLVNPGGFYI